MTPIVPRCLPPCLTSEIPTKPRLNLRHSNTSACPYYPSSRGTRPILIRGWNVASTPRHARVLQNAVEQVLLGLIDVLTFCLRKTYSDRFNDFQRCAEANDMFDVHEWRRAQQDEWDRLSTLVCLHLPFCPLFCTSNRQLPLLIRLHRRRLSRIACPPGDYECSHLHESRPKLFIFPILLTMAWRSRVERVRMFSYPILLYQDIPYNR